MSKRAEEAALEAYPPKKAKWNRNAKRVYYENMDTHRPMRTIYFRGYEQAEKDLALTWEDVKKIEDLCMEVATLFASVGRNKVILEPPFYEEVLRRFNSQREKK